MNGRGCRGGSGNLLGGGPCVDAVDAPLPGGFVAVAPERRARLPWVLDGDPPVASSHGGGKACRRDIRLASGGAIGGAAWKDVEAAGEPKHRARLPWVLDGGPLVASS